ncbi:MAG: hypothetical protein AAGI92_01850 [Pseudomonadota bacterium]
MIAMFPLLVISLIAYNVIVIFGGGVSALQGEVLSLTMMSGGNWQMTVGDLLIVSSLVLLFFEIMKSTRTSNASVLDHLLSTFVFVAFLVEFLLVPGAATSVFFILMVMSAVDLMAGFSVSIRAAGRDVSFN